MTTSSPTTLKRPRIDENRAAMLREMRPEGSFDRAANDAFMELFDARMMLAESILNLEGPREDLAGWMKRREEFAMQHDALGLVRILRLRLRDLHGIDL